ncbi:MAG: type II secretion system protein GspM [Amphiplicatus sp.]
MRAWWSGLSTREQALIAFAGALAGLFLASQLVVKPLADWRGAAAGRAEAAENAYRLVARAASAAAPVKEGEAATTPPQTALLDAARALQIELTFVNARPDGGVEFQAGPIAPDRAFSLFSTLERRYGISILTADIARSGESPSNVRLQATLSR